MNTPTSHCPGFESFRSLKSFTCICSQCGAEKEIFSDEFDREHLCGQCRQKIDFAKCTYRAGAEDRTPR